MHFLNTFIVIFSTYVSVVYGVCNTLPVVENASSNVTSPGPYTEGTVAQFKCRVGFSPSGNRVYTCSGSSWVGGSYECDPIYCGHVQPPKNGYLLEQPTYEIASFIKFGCNDGYTMNGKSQLLCRIDGEWKPPQAPVCVIKDCGDFGSVAHGSTYQDNNTETNKYGSIVKVKCDQGYNINGSVEVVCDKNGNWGTKPTCVNVECGYYPGLDSSCVARSHLALNGLLLFMTCKQDISSRVGPKYVKCRNKKWAHGSVSDENLMACFCDCKVDVDDDIIVVSNLTNGYLKHDNELIWRCKNDSQKSTVPLLKCVDGEMASPACTPTIKTAEAYTLKSRRARDVANTPILEKESSLNYTFLGIGLFFVAVGILAGACIILKRKHSITDQNSPPGIYIV